MQDVIIVGSGLIGLLTARELVSAGVRVSILERAELAGESSWAGGGILSPLYPWRYPEQVNLFAAWSQQRYPQICEELLASTGIDPQYSQNGLLMLDTGDATKAWQWADRFAANLQLVDEQHIQSLEPGLRQPPESGFWLPDVAQIRNPRIVQSLIRYLQQQGVQFRPNCPVTDFIQDKSCVQGVVCENERLFADRVVVASGAWSSRLLASSGFCVPEIEPVRGQMLLFKGAPGLVKRIILSDGHYVIPRRDGHILVGSTMEYVGFDKVTTTDALEELQHVAIDLFPQIKSLKIVQHWSGLRPGSLEGIPFVGAIPDVTGLFINAGHFRNGVVMGPATAHLLADILLERSQNILSTYSLSKFIN
ncbi:MAG: glycine oxidase ThiO [Gammaproteobacteria bacterium]